MSRSMVLKKPAVMSLCFVLWWGSVGSSGELGTTFTYQGRLQEGGSPAEGLYDLRFELFDAAAEGAVVGPVLEAEDFEIADGYLAVGLDFGVGVFDANDLWLQISREKLADGEEILQVDSYPLTIYSAAAVQELHRMLKEKDAEITGLHEENIEIKRQLAEMKEMLNRLAGQQK